MLDGAIIDTGRAAVERLVVAAVSVLVVLVVLECTCVCGARMLEDRARPLDLAGPCGSLVEDVRWRAASVGGTREIVFEAVFGPALALPDEIEDALLSFDCVRVCDLVDGARPS